MITEITSLAPLLPSKTIEYIATQARPTLHEPQVQARRGDLHGQGGGSEEQHSRAEFNFTPAVPCGLSSLHATRCDIFVFLVKVVVSKTIGTGHHPDVFEGAKEREVQRNADSAASRVARLSCGPNQRENDPLGSSDHESCMSTYILLWYLK